MWLALRVNSVQLIGTTQYQMNYSWLHKMWSTVVWTTSTARTWIITPSIAISNIFTCIFVVKQRTVFTYPNLKDILWTVIKPLWIKSDDENEKRCRLFLYNFPDVFLLENYSQVPTYKAWNYVHRPEAFVWGILVFMRQHVSTFFVMSKLLKKPLFWSYVETSISETREGSIPIECRDL